MALKDVLHSYLTNHTKIYKNIIFRTFVTPSSNKHIFIFGAPRSGTTLLQSVLMVSKDIASFDEETGFFMYRDTFTNTLDIPDETYLRMCSDSKDIVALFDKIAEFKIRLNDSLIFLEKTPQHVLFSRNLIKWFPNSKFINLTRDCRDAYISAKNFSQIEQGNDLSNYIKYWRRCIVARNSIRSKNIIDIKYEDFVSSPSEVTKKIMDFIGLEYSENQIIPDFFSQNKRAGKRGFNKLLKPIDSSSVGRWKKELTHNEILKIEAIAKKELVELGYIDVL